MKAAFNATFVERIRNASQRLSIFQLLVIANLGLTLLYYLLGHLYEPHNRVVPTDSARYYMYLRSLFFDGDIDFSNEILHYYNADHLRSLITVTGLPGNQWSIGPAIFLTPFFLLAHGMTLLARAFGCPLAADGYSYLYGLFIYLANWVYALAGFFFLAKVVESYCSRQSALLACLTVMFTTQLTYYFWPDTAMAHNTGFFATCLFLYALHRFGVSVQTILAGALVFLTRWQAIIYLSPLIAFALRDFPWREPWNSRIGIWLFKHLGLVALFLLAISPQFLVWKTLYGTYLTVPHGQGFVDLGRLQLFNVLFSLHRGVFIWRPALLLGCVGLYFLARRAPWLGYSVIFPCVCRSSSSPRSDAGGLAGPSDNAFSLRPCPSCPSALVCFSMRSARTAFRARQRSGFCFSWRVGTSCASFNTNTGSSRASSR